MIKSLIIMALTTFTLQALAADTAPLTDGQIAKTLLTIHDTEIDAGQVAKGKAQHKEVKALANMMIDQHKQAKKDTASVADKNKLETKDSDLSKTMKESSKKLDKDLKNADKATFDKTYVDAMVSGHEKVLATLDNTLIPAAQNTDLKNQLAKTRESVTTHLEHSKKVQASLQ